MGQGKSINRLPLSFVKWKERGFLYAFKKRRNDGPSAGTCGLRLYLRRDGLDLHARADGTADAAIPGLCRTDRAIRQKMDREALLRLRPTDAGRGAARRGQPAQRGDEPMARGGNLEGKGRDRHPAGRGRNFSVYDARRAHDAHRRERRPWGGGGRARARLRRGAPADSRNDVHALGAAGGGLRRAGGRGKRRRGGNAAQAEADAAHGQQRRGRARAANGAANAGLLKRRGGRQIWRKDAGGRSEIPEKERACGRWNRRRGDVGGLAGGGRRAERPDAGLPDRRRHARAHPGA